MKFVAALFAALTFQVTRTNTAPVESKFPATFGFSFQNQRRGPPPPIGPTRPEPVPVGLLEDQVPAVKIVENYSVTNVERNQVCCPIQLWLCIGYVGKPSLTLLKSYYGVTT